MRFKKLTTLLVIILVLILSFSLVACVDDNNNDPSEEMTYEEMISEVASKLANSIYIAEPRNLGVDIVGVAALTDNSNSAQLWKYEVIVKANIALDAFATEEQSNFRIEFNGYNNENVKSTIFSLLYESELDENGKYTASYFYLGLPGNAEPIKINAISLLSLIPGLDEAPMDMDVVSIINLVGNMLFYDGAKDGSTYTFKMDFKKAWGMIYELILPVIEDPSSLSGTLNMDMESIFNEINKIIPELFGDLTYTGVTDESNGTEVDIPVSTVTDVLKYVNQNLPHILADVKFTFDNYDTLVNAEVSALYQAHNAEDVYNKPTHKFDMSITEFVIAPGDPIEYDKGYVLTREQRVEMEAINLLKFSVDGSLYLGSQRLNVAIDMDINPFALMEGFSIENLAELGYLSILITNEELSDNGQPAGDPILTLILDPNKAELVVSLKTPGRSNFPVNDHVYIGGVYGYDELGKIISAMGAPESAAVGNVADEAAPADTITVILNALLSRLDLTNIAENGVVINDCRAMVYAICEVLGIPTSGMFDLANLLHGHLFNWADTLSIKVNENGFKYGVCDIVDANTLNLNGLLDSSYGSLINPDKAVSSDDIQKKYEYGEQFNVSLLGKNSNGLMPDTFKVKGYNRAGKSGQLFDAVLYGYEGYDPYKSGKQTVTVYYGINSKLSKLLSNSLIYGQVYDLLDKMTPLFGAQMMKVDVEVYPKVESDAIALIINGSTTMMAGEDIATVLNATLRYRDGNGNIRQVAVDSSMISCSQPVIDKGMFQYMGKYNITVDYKGIKINQNVTVNELVAKNIKDKLIGGGTIKDIAEFVIRSYDAKGEITEAPVDNLMIAKCIASNIDIYDMVFDKDGVVQNNFDCLSKTITVTISYVVGGLTKTLTLPNFKGIVIENEENIIAMNTSTLFVAANYDLTLEKSALTTITRQEVDPNDSSKTINVVYNVVYNAVANKFEAVLNGKKLDLNINATIYQTKEFNQATNTFSDLTTPVLIELSATRTCLGVGAFKARVEIENVGFQDKAFFDTKPIMFIDKNRPSAYGSMTAVVISKISCVGFNNIPVGAEKATTLDLKWNKAANEWQFVFNGTTIKANEADFKYTLNVEMMKDGKTWVAAEYGASGLFLKDADSAYLPYKITLSVTMGDFTFSDSFIANEVK